MKTCQLAEINKFVFKIFFIYNYYYFITNDKNAFFLVLTKYNNVVS